MKPLGQLQVQSHADWRPAERKKKKRPRSLTLLILPEHRRKHQGDRVQSEAAEPNPGLPILAWASDRPQWGVSRCGHWVLFQTQVSRRLITKARMPLDY